MLYMDYQPNTIGDLTPFRQYAGLFALDLISGETSSLPGEPGCFCGAGIGADMFLRLTLADSGFNLRIRNLSNDSETTAAAGQQLHAGRRRADRAGRQARRLRAGADQRLRHGGAGGADGDRAGRSAHR